GDMNHWNPVLFENRNLVPASTDPNYHLTADITDHAIAWVRRVKAISPDRPFLVYVAPGATHSPHHAPQDWIDRFRSKFDMGRDKYREETIERQKRLGVIPANTKLTERSPELPAWDSLNADQKAALCTDDGSVHGLRRALRLPHEAHCRRREATSGRGQHDLYLHRGRQRGERRGRHRGLGQRKPVLQRLPREVAGQSEGHRRARRAKTPQTFPVWPGA